MSIYVIDAELLRNVDDSIICNILFPIFNERNNESLSIDCNGYAIERYDKIVQKSNSIQLVSWVDLLKKFSTQGINNGKVHCVQVSFNGAGSDADLFLEIAYETPACSTIISVFPYNGYGLSGSQTISHKGKSIKIIGKIEAENEINRASTITIGGSGNIIATTGGAINNAKTKV